jgi:hypothetical protein
MHSYVAHAWPPAAVSVIQVPYKWLRAVGPGLFTGVHMDRVYFPDIDPLTHTCWMPLGDVPISNGAMMICEGAHTHGDSRFATLRERYLVGQRRSGTREAARNGTDSGAENAFFGTILIRKRNERCFYQDRLGTNTRKR